MSNKVVTVKIVYAKIVSYTPSDYMLMTSNAELETDACKCYMVYLWRNPS